jgi:hypothetical protein
MLSRAAHLSVLSFLLIACSRQASAIYGPSLARTDISLAAEACEEARFSHGKDIVRAMQSGKPEIILPVLGSGLKEWQTTPETSALYAARAFCIHELVPDGLPAFVSRAKQGLPTVAVKEFQKLGIEYIFYEPDRAWLPWKYPVDLKELAAKHLNSRWGRQAFLMMTRLGWSQGGCQEGPDQFRQVIRYGQSFLAAYPNAETSNAIRLEMANAYATWWNVSRDEPRPPYSDPKDYQAGALEAKQNALRLYQEYLNAQADPARQVQDRIKALSENPQGSHTYEYFCPDYAD